MSQIKNPLASPTNYFHVEKDARPSGYEIFKNWSAGKLLGQIDIGTLTKGCYSQWQIHSKNHKKHDADSPKCEKSSFAKIYWKM